MISNYNFITNFEVIERLWRVSRALGQFEDAEDKMKNCTKDCFV
jgi:hypothetical protein